MKKIVCDPTVVQIMLTSQSSLQENKLQEMTNRLEMLNQFHHLLFTQYPALNQYCPINNSSTGGEFVFKLQNS